MGYPGGHFCGLSDIHAKLPKNCLNGIGDGFQVLGITTVGDADTDNARPRCIELFESRIQKK